MSNLYDSVHGGGLVLSLPLGTIGSPSLVEIAGVSGFDAVFVDLEHASYTVGEIEAIAIAADAVGISTVVRPPSLDGPLITRLLEVGVRGIYVPHVSSAREADEAVACIRLPPRGHRSVSFNVRAAGYGSMDRASLNAAASHVLAAVMIEDLDGVGAAKAIAATPELDLVAVGPLDLSYDLEARDLPAASLGTYIRQVAEDIHAAANAKMAFPLMHPAFPLSADELRGMHVAFANCGPVPEVRLSRDFNSQVLSIRPQLDREEVDHAIEPGKRRR